MNKKMEGNANGRMEDTYDWGLELNMVRSQGRREKEGEIVIGSDGENYKQLKEKGRGKPKGKHGVMMKLPPTLTTTRVGGDADRHN